ncbi:MAG: BatD family protein [Candidatus Thorarchaeota archaeon]
MLNRPKWVWFILLTIISLNIVYMTLNQSTKPIKASVLGIKRINTSYPKLFVTKTSDREEVAIGDSVVVTITIENIGNKTAYNVTFIDKLNQPWIFEISGLTELSYGQIRSNESRQFSYLVTAKSVGTYFLHSAQIEYYDSEVTPTKFTTISNQVEITVIEPPEDFSLANFNAAITLLIVIIILDILLIIRLIAPKLNRRPKSA